MRLEFERSEHNMSECEGFLVVGQDNVISGEACLFQNLNEGDVLIEAEKGLLALNSNYLLQKDQNRQTILFGCGTSYTKEWNALALNLRIAALNEFFTLFQKLGSFAEQGMFIENALSLPIFKENRTKLNVSSTSAVLKLEEFKKWHQIEDYQMKAVEVANECKAFIVTIRKLDNPSMIVTKDMRYDYAVLKGKIEHMLALIQKESMFLEGEITNYYHLYLLQQVSLLNHYFNRVAFIADKRDQELNGTTKPLHESNTWNGLVKLHEAQIKGIEHPLLQQATNLKIEVTIENDEKIFRDAKVEKDEGKIRYYYNERKTPKHAPHQDRAHYYDANKAIGTATQLSNVKKVCSPTTLGEGKDAYFKHADRELHEKEQNLFRSAMQKIQSGQKLDSEEEQVLYQGKYYRFNSVVKYKAKKDDKINGKRLNYQITHIGHASEYIAIEETVPLNICIDPVQYQTGTGGLVGIGGKIAYDRQTDPAFKTDGYPGVNIVLISHNHFDHLCEQTVKEAFANSNALFVVPVGDAQYMKAWGITNYVEMGSWNDKLTITVKDGKGNSSTYEIRAFPAKHASCRGLHDFYESLYMGYMIREVNKKEVILLTGDTAVLDEEHFAQLSNYLSKKELKIHSACIAHGPDRPRAWMECTHQSTADAVTMHAKFNVMNAQVYLEECRMPPKSLTFEALKEAACYGIGYHQGCYRLGLLSLSDVDTTLLRTFAVLKSYGDLPIVKITEELLNKNVFYCFMDPFEKKALIATLEVYRTVQLDTGCMTANQILALITSHLHVPQPGYRANFSEHIPYTGFIFEYERLIQNRNPSIGAFNAKEAYAFEYFCSEIDPQLYKSNDFNKVLLAQQVLRIYLLRSKTKLYDDKRERIESFINDATLSADNLDEKLGALYQQLFDPQDDKLREEGHSHTAITIIAGLLHFPEFRQTMLASFNKLHEEHNFSGQESWNGASTEVTFEGDSTVTLSI